MHDHKNARRTIHDESDRPFPGISSRRKSAFAAVLGTLTTAIFTLSLSRTTLAKDQKPSVPGNESRKAKNASKAGKAKDVVKKVDLFSLIDVDNIANGKWLREKNELVSPFQPHAWIPINYEPPAAYRITIIGIRDRGNDLALGLSVGNQRLMLILDGHGRHWCGLSTINDLHFDQNEAKFPWRNLLGEGTEYTVECTVHPGSVIVTANGMPVVTWVGDGDRLDLPAPYHQIPAKLFLGTHDAVHRIRSFTLEELPPDKNIVEVEKKEGIVKLVHLKPVEEPRVQHFEFLVNRFYDRIGWPIEVKDASFLASGYFYTKAPSRLVYRLPENSAWKHFSATGYSTFGDPVRYSVMALRNADDKTGRVVCKSEPCRVAKLEGTLERGDRFLSLQIESMAGFDISRVFWLNPLISKNKSSKKGIALTDHTENVVTVEVTNPKQDFAINRVPKGVVLPFDINEERLCGEFLFAHAESRVVYPIPKDAQTFSTIGYCLRSQEVEFEVRVDNFVEPLFKSGKTGLQRINVDIPEGAQTLELLVHTSGWGGNDYSCWLYPRFLLKSFKEERR